MDSRRTVRRALGGIGVVAALVAGTVACSRPAARQAARRSFIVGVRADASPDSVADERARNGALIGWRWRWAMRGFVASMSDDDARALSGDSRVSFVEPDLELTTQAQTTPTGVTRIGADTNASLRLNGVADGDVDADVAVVDTGTDLANPDLNVGAGVTCIGGPCRAGGQDDNGHGTHVSGIIGAKDDGNGVVGVAPGARIVPVKVLNSAGNGATSQVIAGLDWVAANAGRIDVVNMSLGGSGPSAAMSNTIANLVNRGVVVVVASGNSDRNAASISPANSPDVIAVSAVADYNGRPGGGGAATCRNAGTDDSKASFSNFGTVLDIAAPGVCITSLRRGGGTTVMSGTSMASPHVAGAAALLTSRSKPADRPSALALRQRLLAAGTADWTDTSSDGVREPLLNVSDPSVFNPVLVGGSTTPPITTPTTPTTPTTAPQAPAINLSVAGTTTFGIFRVADLTWSGLPGSQVTVYRNNMVAVTAANTGSYRDMAGIFILSASYRVCVSGTSTCSATVPVTF